MKAFQIILILMLSGIIGWAQETRNNVRGTVSYISSQNVYVKFASTDGLSLGDTLFMFQDGKPVPGLIVKDKSSISCVCIPMQGMVFKVGDLLIGRSISQPAAESIKTPVPANPAILSDMTDTVTSVRNRISTQSHISGRISVASATGFSNASSMTQRMRYTFLLNAKNIGNSKVSAETYLSFTHRNNQWQDIREDVFNGLKIISLAAIYEPGPQSRLVVGRRINPKISSMGAIDGIQYELGKNSFSGGIIAGSRPDINTYGFNFKLVQYGGYISHESKMKNGNMQSTLAFVQQTYSGATDRRFSYFQHSSSLIPKLNLFVSAEFDMYRKIDSVKHSDPKLTNLYLSLRYKVSRKLSLSASYSNRQNVIYYETYRDIIERLLATESTQGYQAQASYRPFDKLSMGVTAGYRFRENDSSASKNLYGYLSYTSIPWLKASGTLSATFLETPYLKGNIYSVGLSRDFFKGKLYMNAGYRFVDYIYDSQDYTIRQHMGEMSLTWRAARKLMLALNYEGTFEKSLNYGYLFVQLSKSF